MGSNCLAQERSSARQTAAEDRSRARQTTSEDRSRPRQNDDKDRSRWFVTLSELFCRTGN